MQAVAAVFAMVMMGVGFLISQVLVLREFLLVFQGNEFSIGIVLGTWLLLEALGSGLSGRWADRSANHRRAFISVQLVLSLLLPLTLVLILINRNVLGISPWEAMGYGRIWAVSVVVLGPLGVANGIAFTYGCRLLSSPGRDRLQAAGLAYALESVGAFVGGLIFTFWLVGRFHPIPIAFLLGAANMLSGSLLACTGGGIRNRGRRSPDEDGGTGKVGILSFLTAVLFSYVVLFSPWADRLERWALEQRWKPLVLQESRDSIYGNIAALKLGEQWVLYQNGIPTITLPFPDTTALETLVHLPLLAHDDPKEILFLGGGVGGALAEVLKHRPEAIYYTELDPLLIRTVAEIGTPLVQRELTDPRVRILYEDGRAFLRRLSRRVDVILLHPPDAATLLLNRVFTREFFALARDRLGPRGILAFSMQGSSSYLSEELLRMNRCVWQTLKEVFAHVRAVPGERILYLASPGLDLEAVTPELLAERLRQRRIETAAVGPAYLNYLLAPWQGRWLQEALEGIEGIRSNLDLAPSLLYYTLAYRNAEVTPGLGRAFLALEGRKGLVLVLALIGLNLPFVLWLLRGRTRRGPALSFGILTTGFVGMAMEMVVLLGFQSIYGYLYEWMGLLIATFMAGLACGALCVTRMLERIRRGYQAFCALEGIQLGLLLLCAWILSSSPVLHPAGPGLGAGPKLILFGMNLVAGILVGGEFPLANREAALGATSGSSAVAGRFYALDLLGAWLGTLLASVLLVPLVGIGTTLIFMGATKAFSLLYLLLAR